MFYVVLFMYLLGCTGTIALLVMSQFDKVNYKWFRLVVITSLVLITVAIWLGVALNPQP